MRLILLGPPGAGKGTQAEVLSKKMKVVHVSTGDILRDAVKDGSPVGLKARSFIERGELVTDEIVIEIVLERIKKIKNEKGKCSFILDGFPRTRQQAISLDKSLKKLNTEIAAFFIASPLPGTPFYREALEHGYLDHDSSWINYSPLSNKDSVLSMPNLSAETIRKYHRKAIRNYYFNPRYIILRLLSLRHWYEIKNLYEQIKLFFRIKK